MALAGIEVSYLTRQISKLTEGHYVANIYGIEHQSLLIKLHHPLRNDVLLMVTTRGVWPTDSKLDAIEPNPLVSRLRKSLARHRLVSVFQSGEERIMALEFEGVDNSMHLVCEFFGEGNIILCDHTDKIHALLHKVEVRHRTLQVGGQYAMPPASELGAASATLENILEVLKTELSAAKWLGRSVGLPSRYVERIFAEAQVDPKSPGTSLDEEAAGRIHKALASITRKVIEGEHTPETLVSDSTTTVNPVKLVDTAVPAPGRTFEQLIDEAFTSEILTAGRTARSEQTTQRTASLESRLAEQARAIDLVRQRAAAISSVAQDLQVLAASGVSSITDATVASKITRHEARMETRRGQPIICVADCEIPVKADQSLYAAASALFDESKVQAAAEQTIVLRQKKIKIELDDLVKQATSVFGSLNVKRIRKKSWYERYRWFYTTDGLLAVGGRDSSSNTSLIRKRVEANDLIFHADVMGSPFFILKEGVSAPLSSIREVAHATVCFSRAWRAGMYGTDAFWVRPAQIKKAAPSGQFLPKGSFAIGGTRNFVKVPTLKLCIGGVKINDAHIVTCGPPMSMRAAATCYSMIEPGGLLQTDATKRIKSELTRIYPAFADIDLDEIARALPAGPSRVVESALGSQAEPQD